VKTVTRHIGSHFVALVVTLPFAIWISRVATTDVLQPGAWALPLVAAYYLGMRIGGELIKGYARWRTADRRDRFSPGRGRNEGNGDDGGDQEPKLRMRWRSKE